MTSSQDTITDWISQILALEHIGFSAPHGGNLQTKLKSMNKVSSSQLIAFESIIPEYISLRRSFFGVTTASNADLMSMVNQYMRLLRSPEFTKVFSHQSDFASSILPEIFSVLLHRATTITGGGFDITSQGDVVVECLFDALDGGRIAFKKKRVDVAVLLPVDFRFKDEQQDNFRIPVIAIEIKTNLDKNMIGGIEHSVESLKRTFPNCLYFVLAEHSDFNIDEQDYAATAIDEIYILRKQKRSSARRGQNTDIDIDLIEEIWARCLQHLVAAKGATIALDDRMFSGKLIGRTSADVKKQEA